MEYAIQVHGLCKNYKDFSLQNVTLNVPTGSIVGFVGENGAGKSTLLRTVSGLNKASNGRIEFMGKNLVNQQPHLIAQQALCMVPEGRQLFPEMTARENLLLGAYHYHRDQKRVQRNLERVFEPVSYTHLTLPTT